MWSNCACVHNIFHKNPFQLSFYSLHVGSVCIKKIYILFFIQLFFILLFGMFGFFLLSLIIWSSVLYVRAAVVYDVGLLTNSVLSVGKQNSTGSNDTHFPFRLISSWWRRVKKNIFFFGELNSIAMQIELSH